MDYFVCDKCGKAGMMYEKHNVTVHNLTGMQTWGLCKSCVEDVKGFMEGNKCHTSTQPQKQEKG